MGTHAQVVDLVVPISDDYTVVVPDVRGRGRSVCAHAAHHTWDNYASDVIAFLDQLGFESAFVGGVSLGAAIALHVARRFPERVDALVLVSPAYAGTWLPEQEEALKPLIETASLIQQVGGEQALGHLPQDIRERWNRHDPDSIAISVHATIGSHPFEDLNELGSLLVPSFVVSGDDALHPRIVGDRTASILPNGELAPFALGAETGTAREAAKAITPLIRRFLVGLG